LGHNKCGGTRPTKLIADLLSASIASEPERYEYREQDDSETQLNAARLRESPPQRTPTRARLHIP
jgi:hypothetical protein